MRRRAADISASSLDDRLPVPQTQDEVSRLLRGSTFYEPGKFGFERDIAKRLAWWQQRRERGSADGVTEETPSNTE